MNPRYTMLNVLLREIARAAAMPSLGITSTHSIHLAKWSAAVFQ